MKPSDIVRAKLYEAADEISNIIGGELDYALECIQKAIEIHPDLKDSVFVDFREKGE